MRRRSIWMALVVMCSMAIALDGPDAGGPDGGGILQGKHDYGPRRIGCGLRVRYRGAGDCPLLGEAHRGQVHCHRPAGRRGLVARIKLFEMKPDGLTIMLRITAPR